FVENPEQVLHWQKLAAGEAVDWTTVFAGYKSQGDWPGAHVWRELASAFPNAKAVHTVRPEANWNTPDPRLSRPVAAPRAKDGIVRSCGQVRSASAYDRSAAAPCRGLHVSAQPSLLLRRNIGEGSI